MSDLFSKYKKKIDKKNESIAKEMVKLNIPWSQDFFTRLSASSQRGKTIRGSLALMSLEIFGGKINNNSLLLALSLEYYHNALLIHDDIMDHDDLRRGFPSAHYSYSLIAKSKKIINYNDFGSSMAICLGDASIFVAQLFLSKISNLDNNKYRLLVSLLGQEFIKVGLGQAQDLAFSHHLTSPNSSAVKEMYKYKTARYTFSLPLMAGAIMAGKDKKIIKILDHLGLALGLIFQLSDDNLSLYGDTKITGKALGNDIKENKKTLYRVLLNEKANKIDKKIINNIFESKKYNESDLETIKRLLLKYNIDEDLNKLINSYIKKAKKYSQMLNIDDKKLSTLNNLIVYLRTREK